MREVVEGLPIEFDPWSSSEGTNCVFDLLRNDFNVRMTFGMQLKLMRDRQVSDEFSFLHLIHSLELPLLSQWVIDLSVERIQDLALWHLAHYRFPQCFWLESLVNHFEGIADHIVGFIERPETGENLIVDSFGQQDLVEWIKLPDFAGRAEEDLIIIFLVCFLRRISGWLWSPSQIIDILIHRLEISVVNLLSLR